MILHARWPYVHWYISGCSDEDVLSEKYGVDLMECERVEVAVKFVTVWPPHFLTDLYTKLFSNVEYTLPKLLL